MIKDMNIYWIGGSPCCGKSTISEMLIRDFGFKLYKCDDHLDRYIEIGAKDNIELMKKIKTMSKDETWLREVDEQVEEEFEFYRNVLQTIVKDLETQFEGKSVVVEGAAILPEFIKNYKISNDRYICMVPSEEFQLDKYSKRKWVKGYLSDCSNPKKAFENWMIRDNKYAQIVKNEAIKDNRHLIVVDGSKSIEENYEKVKTIFKLK